MMTRLGFGFLLAILLLSTSAISIWVSTSVKPVYALESTTLAETLNSVMSNVNWEYGDSWTSNWAVILAGRGESAFDEAITADIGRGDYLDALYVARLAELSGYSSQTISNATRTALQQIVMCGSLPITTKEAYGDPNLNNSGCYFVYHRFALWGYKYAEELGLTTKWNITQAFSDFAKAYDMKPEGSVSGEMLWCDPQENWTKSYSSRYYDEHAQTLGVFLKFAQQGVPNASAYADSAWNGVQAHWNTQNGYYGYTGSTVVECEMGNFAQIIAEYKALKGGAIQYWDRVIQDLNYKLLASNWSSPGWASPGVIVHAQTNPQLRLWETMGALIALQALFPDFTPSMKSNWANMLMGSSQAWKGLIASSLNQNGYFRGISTAPVSNDATVCGAAALFLYGIVPVTGSLAIPIREEFCSDLRTPFLASEFTFDYENHKIRIPVNAGEMTFVYGSLPVSYNFTEDGVYDIEFTRDWNQIKSINGQHVALTPAEPQKLDAAEGKASISLSWSPPISKGGAEITNYRIYRGNASDMEVFFKEVENVQSYTDTEVSYATTCFYRVTAFNSFGESEPSNETSATLTQPTTTHGYDGLWQTSDFSIDLSATDPSGVSETYYRINGGPALSVGINGQPLIALESGSNTVEYWSVDKVGNEESPHKILTQVKLDKTTPIGSMQINDGASSTAATSVKLTLAAIDSVSGVDEVRFSNDGVWDTENWETALAYKTWALTPGDGEKTVYYQIKDKAGLVSATSSETVKLDTIAPSGSILINKGAAYTNSTQVDLDLQATDFGSGVNQMRFSNDNLTWSAWERYETSKAWNMQGDDGSKSIVVQFKDNAGQVSSCNGSIILDTSAPIANAGQNQTVNVGSTVSFDGSNSKDEITIASYMWTFGDGTTGNEMTTNHTYSLPGTYSIELMVQDAAGNNGRATVTIVIQTPMPWLFIIAVSGTFALIGAIALSHKKRR